MKGTYTLLIVCEEPFRVRIGSLGFANIAAGYYLYTGSALGVGAQSLEGRLKRHLRHSKKRRWHVDYLTSDRRCRIKAAVYLKSAKRLECSINKAVSEKLNAWPVLPRAGSSDCKCDAHLSRIRTSFGASKIFSLVTSIYKSFDRSPGNVRFTSLGSRPTSDLDLA